MVTTLVGIVPTALADPHFEDDGYFGPFFYLCDLKLRSARIADDSYLRGDVFLSVEDDCAI